MKGTEFVFDCLHLLYVKCQKINPNRGGTCIDTSDWIWRERATINSINKKDSKCYQYTVTVPLNNKEIKKDPQGMTKIKTFWDKYNWISNWKKMGKKLSIAQNVLYAKNHTIYPAYIWKYNSKRKTKLML